MRPDRETETFCAQMFNGFDIDQSGKVNFEEFLLALKLVSNNDPREKLRFAFKMYDIDQNSKLDINELEKLIMGNLRSIKIFYIKSDIYLFFIKE
jgi:neurocalcin delta